MFDYKSAFAWGSILVTPKDQMYKDMCEWARTLPDSYRLKMYSYTVVVKVISDDEVHNVMFEIYHGSKDIRAYLVQKNVKTAY